MIRINIVKSYKLDNGDVSGMFKIPADRITAQVRHELIDFEGVEAELSLPMAQVNPAEATTPEELYNEGIQDMQRGLAKLAQYKLMVPVDEGEVRLLSQKTFDAITARDEEPLKLAYPSSIDSPEVAAERNRKMTEIAETTTIRDENARDLLEGAE